MFHRVQHYELVEMGGRWYQPRAYGDPQPDGSWRGWLVFFPVHGGRAVAPPTWETTQHSLGALADWAASLGAVYLDGALARALKLEEQPPEIARLSEAEKASLADAERLETAAEIERTAAEVDEAAAKMSREDAKRFRQQRLATEAALAATEEATAERDAAIHEKAARDAKEVAAAAARRRRTAQQAAAAPTPRKRGARKKS